jgi:hypothetical protein
VFRDEGLKLVGALTPALVEAHLFVRLAIQGRGSFGFSGHCLSPSGYRFV